MQSVSFRAWLQRRPTVLGTVRTYLADAARVEAHYGDLDRHYAADRLASVLAALTYSAADARRGAPSPSTTPAAPTSLSAYKAAATRYREYRDAART